MQYIEPCFVMEMTTKDNVTFQLKAYIEATNISEQIRLVILFGHFDDLDEMVDPQIAGIKTFTLIKSTISEQVRYIILEALNRFGNEQKISPGTCKLFVDTLDNVFPNKIRRVKHA